MTSSKVINHKLHIFVSCFTLGFWLPFYLVILLKNSGSKVSEVEKPKSNWKTRLEESATITSKNPGYTREKNKNSGRVYTLACAHQIRAKKSTPFGAGIVGKRVWCEVCNAEREVTDFLRI
jgi:hypothetical protein